MCDNNKKILNEAELDNVSGGRISYAPLWEFLKKNGISKYELIQKGIITSTELTRMNANHDFSFKFINRLCAELHCEVQDIIMYIPDED